MFDSGQKFVFLIPSRSPRPAYVDIKLNTSSPGELRIFVCIYGCAQEAQLVDQLTSLQSKLNALCVTLLNLLSFYKGTFMGEKLT